MIHEIFHFLKFQEFINELEKYVFNWEKCNFEPIGNFGHDIKFLTLGKALLILSPLYVFMLILQISTQADNYMQRKTVATKKSIIFRKMGLKSRNPKFNIFRKITLIYKMPTL